MGNEGSHGLTGCRKTPLRPPQFPSAGKAATDFAALTARLETAPFQNAFHPSNAARLCGSFTMLV
jgi:hypothetical protein